MSPLAPQADEVILRLYGVGLGDCFLLAFPREDGGTCFMLIDCGIAKGTPNDKKIMQDIVRDIAEATNGLLDVLVVTHEHHDHTSGFALAEEEWGSLLEVKEVWLPWIEGGGAEADEIRGIKNKLNAGVVKAVQTLSAMNGDVPEELMLEGEFLGVDGFGAESAVVKGYRIAKESAKTVVTCEPGDVRLLPGTKVNAYVLGPPRYRTAKGKELVDHKGRFLLKLLEDESEMYGYHDIGQVPDEAGKSEKQTLSMNEGDDLLASALVGLENRAADLQQPFDSNYRVDWESAMVDPFFYERYSGHAAWRQVNDDWLDAAPDMALRAGGFTNNISLVLAFELPGSKRVLLFPGDAQVGNWLSWHMIDEWKGIEGAQPSDPKLTAKQLLNQVIFYKVGHHGSHNATVKAKGLEMMGAGNDGAGKEMVAYVPVSAPIAHDIMNYCPMPFYPVMKRLQQVTKGHVYLANGRRVEPPMEGSTEAVPGVTRKVSKSGRKLEKNGVVLEPRMPLYTEFVIKDSAT